jgi:OPA family glycerol-3-phosphate transporter-like MFS transporter/OPA family sugar phosphate sensor protein UhpC-like MFS transporter
MSGLIQAFKARPDTPAMLTDPAMIGRRYRYWRVRALATSLVGYAIFYFVRTNISVALPVMGRSLHYDKEQLGIILTVGGVVYGISKFLNGFVGDRANPRYFMALGLFASAIMNVAFGLSSSLLALAIFWFLNNWSQGMGFPPCARTMGHWFSPKERSTTFGIWHTGHMIGAALVSVLTGYLIKYFGGWRLCFFVPAGLAVAGSLLILAGLRDTPGSLGLPPVEVYKGEETRDEVSRETGEAAPYWTIVRRYVLTNRYCGSSASPTCWFIRSVMRR